MAEQLADLSENFVDVLSRINAGRKRRLLDEDPLRRQDVAPSLTAIPKTSSPGPVKLRNLKPDMATMGTDGARVRNSLMVSRPSIPGMKISIITTSNADDSKA